MGALLRHASHREKWPAVPGRRYTFRLAFRFPNENDRLHWESLVRIFAIGRPALARISRLRCSTILVHAPKPPKPACSISWNSLEGTNHPSSRRMQGRKSVSQAERDALRATALPARVGCYDSPTLTMKFWVLILAIARLAVAEENMWSIPARRHHCHSGPAQSQENRSTKQGNRRDAGPKPLRTHARPAKPVSI